MEKLLKKYYKQNKQYLIPVVLILSSFLIFSQVTMKQFDEIGNLQDEIARARTNIENAQKSLNILSSTPQDQLDENFSLVTNALPLEKNIALIFSGLSNAADKANVSLTNVSFRVGGIFSAEANQRVESPYTSIALEANGDINQLEDFSEELFETSPLVEVKSISLRPGAGTYEVEMYYKSANLTRLGALTTIQELTPRQTATLETLREWSN